MASQPLAVARGNVGIEERDPEGSIATADMTLASLLGGRPAVRRIVEVARRRHERPDRPAARWGHERPVSPAGADVFGAGRKGSAVNRHNGNNGNSA